MRVKVGDRYRDYVNTSYVVRDYKDYVITFIVDDGKQQDEKWTKKDFESELLGNRFFREQLKQRQ